MDMISSLVLADRQRRMGLRIGKVTANPTGTTVDVNFSRHADAKGVPFSTGVGGAFVGEARLFVESEGALYGLGGLPVNVGTSNPESENR